MLCVNGKSLDLYERYELESLIGFDNLDDFDVDAVEDALTLVGPDGRRYWRSDLYVLDLCSQLYKYRIHDDATYPLFDYSGCAS